MHNDLHNLDKLEHRSGHMYSSDVQSGWDRNVTAEKNPKIIKVKFKGFLFSSPHELVSFETLVRYLVVCAVTVVIPQK